MSKKKRTFDEILDEILTKFYDSAYQQGYEAGKKHAEMQEKFNRIIHIAEEKAQGRYRVDYEVHG